MADKKEMWPIVAVIGAIGVSGLLAGELLALLFGVSYSLPDGMPQTIAFVISGLVSFAFFVWFGLRAYVVETELMIGVGGALDET